MNKQTISDYVDAHRSEAIEFLQKLLRIPSPTGQEKAVAEFIAQKLLSEGFQPTMPALDPNRPNVVCDWEGTPGRSLLFNGHIDVFPPGDAPSRDPWSGEIIGNRIYARGATDMKAGVSAGILAMCFLKRMGFQPNGKLSIGLNCDEEQGSKYGILHCLDLGLLKADFTICMEASEDTIIIDTDGRIAWKVTFVSDGWHAGTRLNKIDSLQMAVRAIEAINRYDKKLLKERYFGGTDFGAVINVTSISAGKEGRAVNMHPNDCTIWIDRRYTRGETIESALKELQELFDTDPVLQGKYTIEKLYSCPRIAFDPNDSDIYACMDAYRDIFHTPIRLGRRNGGGDAVKLAVGNNQRVPQLGPGIYDVLGSDEEYVELEQYLNFIKVYMLFALRYLSKEE